jgi:osmoprotectant transport system substrate-binding protein
MSIKGKHMLGVIGVAAVLAAVAGCGSTSSTAGGKPTIVVGSKNFTENILLGDMTVDLLKQAGYPVENKTDLGGTTVNREALKSGQISLYWEYTGTALVDFDHVDKRIANPQAVYDIVKKDDAKIGLVWLKPAPLNDTYSIMLRQSTANRLDIHTISQWAHYINTHPGAVKFASDNEFAVRPDGLPGVEKMYHFTLPSSQVVLMDSGLVYTALKDKKVSAAMGFTTNGAIEAYHLVNLTDNKKFFPVYNPAPVVRKQILHDYPKMSSILGKLAPKLTTNVMIHLTNEVDLQHKLTQTVAQNWLSKEGLLK